MLGTRISVWECPVLVRVQILWGSELREVSVTGEGYGLGIGILSLGRLGCAWVMDVCFLKCVGLHGCDLV